jgi:large subunit ribosomal protein L1
MQRIYSSVSRTYVSRAHPSASTQTIPISEAIVSVLDGIEERKITREKRWQRGADKRAVNGIKENGPYRNQDETIELALNLNLDPRKPGQALRGSIPLPHGTGKKVSIVVFISDNDTETIAKVKAAGASHIGGQSLIESIQNGDLALNFDRALATPEMMPSLSKIARVLGPRGLMPNAKLNAIHSPDKIIDAVKAEAAGMVQFRTDKNGIIHAGIGKGSFKPEQLQDNIREFMNTVHIAKPESFGKGKKKGSKKGGSSVGNKNVKYYLKAHLTSAQSKGSINIDLRTVDPTSSYFMSVPPS